jgi:hypothetical protein
MAQTNIFSAGYAKRVLDVITNNGTLTSTSALYLALLTTVPTQDDGAGCIEFTSYENLNNSDGLGPGSYRPKIAFPAVSITAGTGAQTFQSTKNSAAVSYTISPGVTTTVINGIAVVTANSKSTTLTFGSGGNVVWFGDVNSPAPSVIAGNTLTFAIDQIEIKLF